MIVRIKLKWFIEALIYFDFLYLNDGSGYACAGQASANDSPPILSNVPIDFDSEENLGAAPPIGSDAIKGSIVLH